MKKFFSIFFITLGVIFSILILIAIYFFITDPFNLKPMIFGSSDTRSTQSSATTDTGSETDQNPALSDTQEKALETFGIDPAAVPASITPEQEACFIEKLGAARVEEIKAGDSPTATEFFTAKSCI